MARRLPEAARELAPRLPLYERLREALARYRGLADHPAWQQPLPPLPGAGRAGGKLEPGQAYAGLALLAQRLQALDDLAPRKRRRRRATKARWSTPSPPSSNAMAWLPTA